MSPLSKIEVHKLGRYYRVMSKRIDGQSMQSSKSGPDMHCEIVSDVIQPILTGAEVMLFFGSPFIGPEITIPAIAGVVITKAVIENPPRIDLLCSQVADQEYRKALNGSIHYVRKVADNCLEQKAPLVVVGIARGIGDTAHRLVNASLDIVTNKPL